MNFWKVEISLNTLEWCRIDMHEEVVASKKITEMNLSILEPFQHFGIRNPNGRNQPGSSSPQFSQAWDFESEPSPNGNPFEPEPAPWLLTHSVPFFIGTLFVSQLLVTKFGERKQLEGSHGGFFGTETIHCRKKQWKEMMREFKRISWFSNVNLIWQMKVERWTESGHTNQGHTLEKMLCALNTAWDSWWVYLYFIVQ